MLQGGADASVRAVGPPSATQRPLPMAAVQARRAPAHPDAVVIASAPVRSVVATTTTSPPAPATTTTAPRVAPTTTTTPAPVVRIVPTTTTTVPRPAPTTTTTTTTAPPAGTHVQTVGVVTYYDHPAGRCASPWLPFGTVVQVTNPANGATVTCVVDDREADTARSIDLATGTFALIAPLWQGVVDARLSW